MKGWKSVEVWGWAWPEGKMEQGVAWRGVVWHGVEAEGDAEDEGFSIFE